MELRKIISFIVVCMGENVKIIWKKEERSTPERHENAVWKGINKSYLYFFYIRYVIINKEKKQENRRNMTAGKAKEKENSCRIFGWKPFWQCAET